MAGARQLAGATGANDPSTDDDNVRRCGHLTLNETF
jgi:hypothetical protein